jgi:hypothetical protein
MGEDTPSPLGNVITIDDDRIKSHLDRVVRGSVEETLNAFGRRRTSLAGARFSNISRVAAYAAFV